MSRTQWRRDEVVADLEQILPCHKNEAAKRLGYSKSSHLYRALNRWGRLDLWKRLEGTGWPR